MKIYANTSGITLSKSELTKAFTEAFNTYMGEGAADDYFLRLDIYQDGDGVMVDIEAETTFDENDNGLTYDEYVSIMKEVGQQPMSISEFYQEMADQPTLEERMDSILKTYNPEWYFELYNACRIQAYLDNAILVA